MSHYRTEAKDPSVLRYNFVQIGICYLHLQTVQIQWSTLQIGAARSPQLVGTYVSFYKTQHPKVLELKDHHCQNVKSQNRSPYGKWHDQEWSIHRPLEGHGNALFIGTVPLQYMTTQATQLRSWSGTLWLQLSSIAPATTCLVTCSLLLDKDAAVFTLQTVSDWRH
jgi:hypothetical protein